MPKMYDPAVSRITKRSAPSMTGYYTAREAAEKLGVDIATLKYRRDHADAKAYWSLQGVQFNDPMNELLTQSHLLYNGHHYYDKVTFDQFAKIYNARPSVRRARKGFARFPAGRIEVASQVITSEQQAAAIGQFLTTMIKANGKVAITVWEE